KVKLYEYGDFIITEDNEIYDFSDQGLQKEYIVIPETINGHKLQVAKKNEGIIGDTYVIYRYGEMLEKIYVPMVIKNFNEEKEYYYFLEQLYNSLSKHLNKSTKSFFCNGKKIPVNFFNRFNKLYVNETFSARISAGLFFVNFFRAQNTGNNSNEIVAYSNTRERCLLANIEFMYNYDGAPNQGYYWIDDLENGETLSYIPQNPTREGYTFKGWYQDKECEIPYDFKEPYIKQELLKGINDNQEEYWYYPEDYVTFIYAKWIEN
ncbi:MAG: InlB B-repeat-containing protein, partial [Clostridia bacterium]|nr:InlB B-repeat-containing protein [Clostridia bacterium]